MAIRGSQRQLFSARTRRLQHDLGPLRLGRAGVRQVGRLDIRQRMGNARESFNFSQLFGNAVGAPGIIGSGLTQFVDQFDELVESHQAIAGAIGIRPCRERRQQKQDSE